MHGKIVKGIAGFYDVHVVGSGVYRCKAKGIFRKEGTKPLVGDDVELEILDEKGREGNVIRILPRKNALIRPAVANIDQVLAVFAAAGPSPRFNLLDRFLVRMESEGIPTVLCFNKEDLVEREVLEKMGDIYQRCSYPLVFASAVTGAGMERLRRLLAGKTTAVAGPSGVGKSSIINILQPDANMETGTISRKIQRGKHTTRHSELIPVDGASYVMDTPGFSSLYVNDFEKEKLKIFFPEFSPYEGQCRFLGCDHIHEPGCAVKDAVGRGEIHGVRYGDYREMYEEIKQKRRY